MDSAPARAVCAVCAAARASLRCTCGVDVYCSTACQRAAWPTHKQALHSAAARDEALQAAWPVVARRMGARAGPLAQLEAAVAAYGAGRSSVGDFVVQWLRVAGQAAPAEAAHLLRELQFVVPVEALPFAWAQWDAQRDWAQRGADAQPFVADGASIGRNLARLVADVARHRERSETDNVTAAALLTDLLVHLNDLLPVVGGRVTLEAADDPSIVAYFVEGLEDAGGKRALTHLASLTGEFDGDEYFPDFAQFILGKLTNLTTPAPAPEFDDTRLFFPTTLAPAARTRMIRPGWSPR